MGRVQAEEYTRHTDGASTYNLQWSTWHASALGRVQTRFPPRVPQLYAEVSAGLSRATSTLREEEADRAVDETHFGVAVSGSVGVIIMPFSHLGIIFGLGYGAAPTVSNELDETHNGAGFTTNAGLRTVF